MPNVLLMEGFDLYNGTTGTTGLGQFWYGNIGGSLPLGRWGVGQSWQTGSGTSSRIERDLGTIYPSISVGFSFMFAGGGGHQNPVFTVLGENSEYHMGLRPHEEGGFEVWKMSARNSGTVVGSCPNGKFAVGTWNYLEVEVTVHPTNGVFRLYMNGERLINLENINTRSGTTSQGIKRVSYGNHNGVSGGPFYRMDDMYVAEGATRLGERRIDVYRPITDVQKQFTPSTGTDNFAMVDDTLTNGDVDYISTSTTGATDLYEFSNLTSTPMEITAARIMMFARKSDTEERILTLQVNSGASVTDGPDHYLSTDYRGYERIMPQDPAGGNWNVAKINGLIAGPKVKQ